MLLKDHTSIPDTIRFFFQGKLQITDQCLETIISYFFEVLRVCNQRVSSGFWWISSANHNLISRKQALPRSIWLTCESCNLGKFPDRRHRFLWEKWDKIEMISSRSVLKIFHHRLKCDHLPFGGGLQHLDTPSSSLSNLLSIFLSKARRAWAQASAALVVIWLPYKPQA